MDLINLINNHKMEILDKIFLIEYNLFFNESVEQYCKFALDENSQLKELHNIILYIKKIDKNSEFYLNTYNINFVDEKLFIYSDTLWINTTIEIDEISMIFDNFKGVQPSSIDLLIEDELLSQMVEFVISSNNKIEDYNLFIESRDLNKIKTLYWD